PIPGSPVTPAHAVPHRESFRWRRRFAPAASIPAWAGSPPVSSKDPELSCGHLHYLAGSLDHALKFGLRRFPRQEFKTAIGAKMDAVLRRHLGEPLDL